MSLLLLFLLFIIVYIYFILHYIFVYNSKEGKIEKLTK